MTHYISDSTFFFFISSSQTLNNSSIQNELSSQDKQSLTSIVYFLFNIHKLDLHIKIIINMYKIIFGLYFINKYYIYYNIHNKINNKI